MATMTTLQNLPTDGPSTTERRFTAEQHLRRNLGITDSARERVRTRLIDVAIEDSPVKRDRPRDRDKDQLLLSKIRGVSSSPDGLSESLIQRPSIFGVRSLSAKHKSPSASSYSFPNEYSIPTIPLPPSPNQSDIPRKLPESPPRFRRRGNSAESTPTKSTPTRGSSVRFSFPEVIGDDIVPDTNDYPPTSTPNLSHAQRLIDQEAEEYDSAKSFISAYATPHSPPRRTPARFRRLQTPAPGTESPSTLLRTLSRATSVTPRIEPTPPSTLDEQEQLSLDEAEKTLDSIIESAEDASTRIRHVLEQSRHERSIRRSITPVHEEEESPTQAEMSVWEEKSFFRRMARKVPGGWAFTPQPKLRTMDVAHNHEKQEVKGSESKVEWWEFWRKRRKTEETVKSEAVSSPQLVSLQSQRPPSPSKPSSPSLPTLSEKRLRLARSLQLLQSDIRLAREGIESLESRLEAITHASTARQIDSERRLTLRKARGDPPPAITNPGPPFSLPQTGTYVWIPMGHVWLIGLLWVILGTLAGLSLWVGYERSVVGMRRWEPYSFGDWTRDESWPT